MSDLLDFFYTDNSINDAKTLVKGTDLCELLGLFFDLASLMQEEKVILQEEKEKYKMAYAMKAKQQRKEEEKNAEKEESNAIKEIRSKNTTLLNEKAAL